MKKDLFKKITAAMLAAVMAVTSVSASAEGAGELISNQNASSSAAIELNLKDLLLVHYDNDLSIASNFSYGAPIPCYDYLEKNLVEISTMKVYPVFANGCVIGTLKETIGEDTSYFSYSEEYAEEINNFIKDKNEPFNFVFEDENLFICSAEKFEFVKSYSADSYKDTASFNIKTISRLNFYSTGNEKICKTDKFARGDVITTQLSIAPWNQGQTGLCWAGAVEAIGEYVAKNYSYTPQKIAEAMGIDQNAGAKVKTVKEAFSKLYGLNSEIYGGVPAFSFIASKINSDKPLYMDFQTTDKGHAVTLIGYGATSSKYYIRIMDTYGGQYTTLEYINGLVQLSIGSKVYTWNNTVYIK